MFKKVAMFFSMALVVLTYSIAGSHQTTKLTNNLTYTTPEVVYSEDFETLEWSLTSRDVTPIGGRRFLGQFGNETVTLSLEGLPDHMSVTVSFDLYLIRSWDGNAGPDIWSLSESGQQSKTLLYTTFSNCPLSNTTCTQAFPGTYPQDSFPRRTGAAENNTLGYFYKGSPEDAVYTLDVVFPHSDEELTLNFQGVGLEPIDNESWGLDNVIVTITSPSGDEVVYRNDFEESEWSNTTTDVTPVGSRRFLGQFGNDEVTLSLANLPAHTDAIVSFDLYLIRSWDGNETRIGPDIWSLSESGQQSKTLLYTTFSNCPLSNTTCTQAFPGTYPQDSFPRRTGAAENNTLGYFYKGSPEDAVYTLDVVFPHSDEELTLNFQGVGLEPIDNESWGLDNIQVSVFSQQRVFLPSVLTE